MLQGSSSPGQELETFVKTFCHCWNLPSYLLCWTVRVGSNSNNRNINSTRWINNWSLAMGCTQTYERQIFNYESDMPNSWLLTLLLLTTIQGLMMCYSSFWVLQKQQSNIFYETDEYESYQSVQPQINLQTCIIFRESPNQWQPHYFHVFSAAPTQQKVLVWASLVSQSSHTTLYEQLSTFCGPAKRGRCITTPHLESTGKYMNK